MFYLSCVDCGVMVRLPNAQKILVTSSSELYDLMAEWNQTQCQTASSMDFPEENTDDQSVIDLCNEIMKAGE